MVKRRRESFVFQGVQMLFSGGFTTPWIHSEKRASRFVFIGRNLKTQELEAGFEKCIANLDLRFKVGQKVQANATGGWQNGTIIKCWDDGNPYRVQLEDAEKTEVWAPEDSDVFIRLQPSVASNKK